MRATIIAVACSAAAVAAFTSPSTHRRHHHKIRHAQRPLASTTMDDNNFDEETSTAVPQQQQEHCYSLEGSDLAGNWGFDPLGLARTKENLWMYREAEMKHARLAMLAALGWPVSEVLNRPIAEALGLPSVVEEASRVPSLLNGGLDSISPVWWGSCLGISAAIDMYGTAKAKSNDPNYIPGRLGFDPLHMCENQQQEQQRQLELAEISNGRLAMIAVTGFALQEYTTQAGLFVEEVSAPMLLAP